MAVPSLTGGKAYRCADFVLPAFIEYVYCGYRETYYCSSTVQGLLKHGFVSSGHTAFLTEQTMFLFGPESTPYLR
jgi:hypothetical protein